MIRSASQIFWWRTCNTFWSIFIIWSRLGQMYSRASLKFLRGRIKFFAFCVLFLPVYWPRWLFVVVITPDFNLSPRIFICFAFLYGWRTKLTLLVISWWRFQNFDWRVFEKAWCYIDVGSGLLSDAFVRSQWPASYRVFRNW